jgi:putative transposase
MLITGEGHLRLTLSEYIDHYDGRRPHRALQQNRPQDVPSQPPI